jgi:archaellum component FlaC
MDPFSLVIGTLTLVQLCIKSSALLYDAVNSIKTKNQEIKLFVAEIKSLIDVLQALEQNVEKDANTFGSLNCVLEQCQYACDNLNKAVAKASGDSKQQFEGIKIWIRLKRHEGDIEAFKKLIDSYKATLTIAIADANL